MGNKRSVYEEDYQDIIDHYGKKAKEPWSKKELADYLGVSTSTIYNYAWQLGLVEGRTAESYHTEMAKRRTRYCGELGSEKRRAHNDARKVYAKWRRENVEKPLELLKQNKKS